MRYGIIYIDKRSGLSGCSPDVFSPITDQIELIRWYESRHKYAKVCAVVEDSGQAATGLSGQT